MVEAVFDHLKKLNIQVKIVGMCFDTTYSNTGPHKGACALLEKLLNRELLPLSCRHHTSEVIVSNVFKHCLNEILTSPDVNFFSNIEKT